MRSGRKTSCSLPGLTDYEKPAQRSQAPQQIQNVRGRFFQHAFRSPTSAAVLPASGARSTFPARLVDSRVRRWSPFETVSLRSRAARGPGFRCSPVRSRSEFRSGSRSPSGPGDPSSSSRFPNRPPEARRRSTPVSQLLRLPRSSKCSGAASTLPVRYVPRGSLLPRTSWNRLQHGSTAAEVQEKNDNFVSISSRNKGLLLRYIASISRGTGVEKTKREENVSALRQAQDHPRIRGQPQSALSARRQKHAPRHRPVVGLHVFPMAQVPAPEHANRRGHR